MNQATWDLIKPIAAQGLRDFLRTIGMLMLTHGAIQNGPGVEAFIGAGMTLGGLFWGWFTTSGYLKVTAMLMKVTARHTQADAVATAKAAEPGAAVKLLLAGLLLGGLLFAGDDAHAQVKLTGNLVRDLAPAAPRTAAASNSVDGAISDLGTQLQKITKDLVDKAIADVTAAATDAENHKDQISLPCWQSMKSLLSSLPSQWETPPQLPIGLALSIQIQRDILNSVTGNDAGSLKVACAALIGDQVKIIANVAGLLGVRVATGGLF